MKRALKEGVVASRDEAALPAYWALLERNLAERHGAKPVHTLAEMQRLQQSFPDNIKLFGARRGGALCAGVLVYESQLVARAQYIATSPEGREIGALDLLIHDLLTGTYAAKPYIDLGSSMESPGVLDAGLVEQKEGFGARAVALDTWEWQLA
jgi:hypothetical protein